MFRGEVHILPLQAKSSLRLKPVPTAINTIVRSLVDSVDNSGCVSSTVSTSESYDL